MLNLHLSVSAGIVLTPLLYLLTLVKGGICRGDAEDDCELTLLMDVKAVWFVRCLKRT